MRKYKVIISAWGDAYMYSDGMFQAKRQHAKMVDSC